MTPPDRMTMIERVAAALEAVPVDPDPGGPHGADYYERSARAAIAAMRDPTEGMMLDPRVRGDDDIEAWQAMIDAALTEKPL